METYSLKELEEITGISGRVIRDYIARGYLPGPESKGRNAQYSDKHLNRLLCLQVLRKSTPKQFTLDMLGGVLNSLTDKRIQDIAEGREEVQALTVGNSATTALAPGAIRDALVGSGKDSALGQMVRALDDLTKLQPSARKSQHENWVSVAITPDIELRARNLSTSDIAHLEQLADHLGLLLRRGAECTTTQ